MKKFFTLITCFITLSLSAQKQLSLDNNLTGLYSENKSGLQFGLNFTGNNSFDFNKNLGIDFGTNYSLRFNPKVSENELLQRVNLDYHKEHWDVFSTYQYNYSLVREITSDNWIGLGGGLKDNYNWGKLSVSYAVLFQNTNYLIDTPTQTLRHSLRGKIKFEKKLLSFSTEYFFQPSFSNFDDYIVLGTSKLILLPKNNFNFIIQDIYNFRSLSNVKTLHNLTIGFAYKFSKEFSKK